MASGAPWMRNERRDLVGEVLDVVGEFLARRAVLAGPAVTWWTRKPGSTTTTSRAVGVVAPGEDVDLVAESRQRAREFAHVDVHPAAVAGTGLGQGRRVIGEDGESSHGRAYRRSVNIRQGPISPCRTGVRARATPRRDSVPGRNRANPSRPARCRRAGRAALPFVATHRFNSHRPVSRGSRTTTTSPTRTRRHRRTAVRRSPGT